MMHNQMYDIHGMAYSWFDYVDFGCETSENKNLENFPSFRRRRRSSKLEVEDEEYSVCFDGIFSRR